MPAGTASLAATLSRVCVPSPFHATETKGRRVAGPPAMVEDLAGLAGNGGDPHVCALPYPEDSSGARGRARFSRGATIHPDQGRVKEKGPREESMDRVESRVYTEHIRRILRVTISCRPRPRDKENHR
jgi:hypothetical protein